MLSRLRGRQDSPRSVTSPHIPAYVRRQNSGLESLARSPRGVIGWSQPRPECYRFLRGLVEAGYGDRIMFGSDQMVWTDRIEKTAEAIEQADFLTCQQKGDIFYNNAARFLRREPK